MSISKSQTVRYAVYVRVCFRRRTRWQWLRRKDEGGFMARQRGAVDLEILRTNYGPIDGLHPRDPVFAAAFVIDVALRRVPRHTLLNARES